MHYDYFRNPGISERYGVAFGEEIPTRLKALRVGFVRVNYRLNGGFMTMESMRWTRFLHELINRFVLANAEQLDLVQFNKLDVNGVAIQVAAVSLLGLRLKGQTITERSLAAWNRFEETKI
jgi:hypothetical protein